MHFIWTRDSPACASTIQHLLVFCRVVVLDRFYCNFKSQVRDTEIHLGGIMQVPFMDEFQINISLLSYFFNIFVPPPEQRSCNWLKLHNDTYISK